MDKEEIKQIAYDFTTSKGDAEKLEARILSLFGVSKSFTDEQLVDMHDDAYSESFDEWKSKWF